MNNTTESVIKLCHPDHIVNAARDILRITHPKASAVDMTFSIPDGTYLSDNMELMNYLTALCMQGGNRILLKAPCGLGKTYAMLTYLNNDLQDDQQIIMFCPYIVHTEQNSRIPLVTDTGMAAYPHMVTSAKQSRFKFDSVRPTVAVYDQSKKLMITSNNRSAEGTLNMMEALSRTVIVLDEVHLLKEQENFREEAIRSIQKLSDEVIACGGTVIYLTATPRKISGIYFDHFIECHQVDLHGNVLPVINARKIELLDWHKLLLIS